MCPLLGWQRETEQFHNGSSNLKTVTTQMTLVDLLLWGYGRKDRTVECKDFLNSPIFVKTLSHKVWWSFSWYHWNCRTVHAPYPLCKWTLCTEVREYQIEVTILRVFNKERELKINYLMAMSITALKLQLCFRNWLNILLEFSTLKCQYLY